MKQFKSILISLIFILLLVTVAFANDDDTVTIKPYTEQQIYTITARSAGEARLSGVTAVAYVACTIHNRLQRGYGNAQVEYVLNAYYAKDFVPTKGELSIVNFYLNGGRCPNDILYALSHSDTVYLGFNRHDADYAIGTKYETTYFYSKWGN